MSFHEKFVAHVSDLCSITFLADGFKFESEHGFHS